jgi:hypothetical protein
MGKERRVLFQARGPAEGKGGTEPGSPTIITADFKLKWPPGHVDSARYQLRKSTLNAPAKQLGLPRRFAAILRVRLAAK